MTKKTKIKELGKDLESIRDAISTSVNMAWSNKIHEYIAKSAAYNYLDHKCSFCKKLEKERKAREKKEAVRRSKKITMTVGELEDKLDEARSYDW